MFIIGSLSTYNDSFNNRLVKLCLQSPDRFSFVVIDEQQVISIEYRAIRELKEIVGDEGLDEYIKILSQQIRNIAAK